MIIKNMSVGDWGNTKALFTIEVDGVWISGFKVMETNGKNWIAKPTRKTKDGEYIDTVGMSKEKKDTLEKIALEYFEKIIESKITYK